MNFRVQSGTAPVDAGTYTCHMQLVSMKTFFAATVWVSAVSMAGIAGNMSSVSSWTVLAGVALLPALVMMQRWNGPGQTMSQSIQEARR